MKKSIALAVALAAFTGAWGIQGIQPEAMAAEAVPAQSQPAKTTANAEGPEVKSILAGNEAYGKRIFKVR